MLQSLALETCLMVSGHRQAPASWCHTPAGHHLPAVPYGHPAPNPSSTARMNHRGQVEVDVLLPGGFWALRETFRVITGFRLGVVEFIHIFCKPYLTRILVCLRGLYCQATHKCYAFKQSALQKRTHSSWLYYTSMYCTYSARFSSHKVS